ncbi:MAG: FkbM family methyltransferase [Thaumarchaeota archaeon]|nr:MAG: FkbM family methyltransferase [Nitrososphaerota archaeon]
MRGMLFKAPYLIFRRILGGTMLDRMHIDTANAFYQQILKWLHIPGAEYIYALLEYNLTILLERKVVEYIQTVYGERFIDIGAYAGYYSKKLGNGFGIVYAFEPDPQNYQLLLRRIGILKGHIIPINKAVYSYSGIRKFYYKNVSPLRSLVVHHESDSISVETISLHDFVRERIDLIKVDAEFAEYPILVGASDVMHRIKRWVIEIHDPNVSKNIEYQLTSHGYKIRWLDELHILGEQK